MDPVTIGLIAASTLGGIGSSLAAGSRQKAQQIQEALRQEGEAKMSAQELQQKQTQAALANLIAAYRSTLGA